MCKCNILCGNAIFCVEWVIKPVTEIKPVTARTQDRMTSQPDLTTARRLLATNEYKSIKSQAEKGARLHINEGFSFRTCGTALNISYQQVRRAVLALQRNRPVGQNGRPTRLSSTMEQSLIDQLKGRAERCDSAYTSEVRKLVRMITC